MPLIQITATEGTLNKAQQAKLVSQVSNAVLIAERADINDQAAQSLVWGYYHELPIGACYVGGVVLDKSPVRIAITTPEGALNVEARHSLVRDIGIIVDKLVGQFEGRLNHWTMLYELDEGNWSGAGQIFHLADIQAAMNIKVA